MIHFISPPKGIVFVGMNLLRGLFFMSPLMSAVAWGGPQEAQGPPKYEFSFEEIFGTFDRGELQRGFQVFKGVCYSCHSLKHVRFEKLKALGFSEAEIKSIAREFEVDGPEDEEGKPTKRPAGLSDVFQGLYPNEEAARAANNGSLPPDLSLMVKARPHGAHYLKALLLGYEEKPEEFSLAAGMHYNAYFSGNQIGMPPPLTDNIVQYQDGTPATIKQMAHDVTAFLAWAAEPELEERKRMGVRVLIFLLVFAGLMFLVNKRTWEAVPKSQK